MSKLWLVEFMNAYYNPEFCGIFSSKEKAEEYIAKFSQSEQQYFDINEVTVDEP